MSLYVVPIRHYTQICCPVFLRGIHVLRTVPSTEAEGGGSRGAEQVPAQRRRLPQCPPPHCFPSERIPAKPSPGTRKFPGVTPPATSCRRYGNAPPHLFLIPLNWEHAVRCLLGVGPELDTLWGLSAFFGLKTIGEMLFLSLDLPLSQPCTQWLLSLSHRSV